MPADVAPRLAVARIPMTPPHSVPLLTRVRRVPLRALPGRLARRALHAVYRTGEQRIYRHTVADAPAIRPTDPAFARDRWEDLRLYQPAASGDAGREQFLRDAEVRLGAGAHVYTIAADGVLQHFSWLMTAGERPGVMFERRFLLPRGAAFLWDDYTHPAARGRGLHAASLRHRLAEAWREGAAQAYIAVAADNGPSRHNIERAGFRHCASVHSTWLLGRERVRVVDSGVLRS